MLAGDLLIAGYDERPVRLPMCYLDMAIAEHTVSLLKIASIPGGQVLLGRNVINQFYTELNGPDLTFDLLRSRSF
jgi:hypothetical protein